MKLYEYQAKDRFSAAGIPIPVGRFCSTPAEAQEAARQLGAPCVLKTQVLTGGRGKAGGIRFAESPESVVAAAVELAELSIKGERSVGVLVEERLPIREELYLAVVADPDERAPVLLFCASGGVEVEELVRTRPDELLRVPVDPRYGFWTHRFRTALADRLPPAPWREALVEVARRLYQVFWSEDAEVAEINPLVVLDDGRLVAADGKLSVDDSARFRHPDHPRNGSDGREDRAKRHGLAFVELEGEVGILSNGAGLTMATMDQLAAAGARPANFLDCGARIIENGVLDGLRLILEDPGVRVILVNIFGGGVRCDVIAEKLLGAVDALAEARELRVPVIACLQGRNQEEGRTLLAASPREGLHCAATMEDAVTRAAEAARAG